MEPAFFPALAATLGTWLATAAGAASVLLLRRPASARLGLFSGFAAGVMIAAGFWSLLLPAVQRAALGPVSPWIVVTAGLVLGAMFMWTADLMLSRFQAFRGSIRLYMLIGAITLHNIPEGLAVGVAFGALSGDPSPEALAGAIGVAVGIGLQNIPEGAAVSLPLPAEGLSRKKSFLIGQATGIVEPFAGAAGALLVSQTELLLPWALSFAAGTMVTVAVHDLIPDCREKCNAPWLSTFAILLGFSVMTWLDVWLS